MNLFFINFLGLSALVTFCIWGLWHFVSDPLWALIISLALLWSWARELIGLYKDLRK